MNRDDGYMIDKEIELATFSEGDPSGWIYQAENFFEVQDTLSDLKRAIWSGIVGLANSSPIKIGLTSSCNFGGISADHSDPPREC